jgi:hypothetical protein
MLMIIGWTGAEYEQAVRQDLTALIAGLCSESALTGCVAALPVQIQQRDWILSLLSSMQKMAAIRIGALVSASTLTEDDLRACEANGLDEIVILQDSSDPTSAIERVRAHGRTSSEPGIGIRVWLGDAVSDRFLTQVCRWKHGTDMRARVSLSPFRTEGMEANGPASPTSTRFVCEWFKSTLTLTTSGAVMPCPAHLANLYNAKPARSASELLQQKAAWGSNAASDPLCSSCRLLARFKGEEVLGSPALVRPFVARQANNATQCRDHVGCDVSTLSPTEQEAAVTDLVSRVRCDARGCAR